MQNIVQMRNRPMILIGGWVRFLLLVVMASSSLLVCSATWGCYMNRTLELVMHQMRCSELSSSELSSVLLHCCLSIGNGAGIVVCLQRGATDLRMVKLMPLPPLISCFIKSLNGYFISLLPAFQVVLVKRPLNGCCWTSITFVYCRTLLWLLSMCVVFNSCN